MIKSKWYPNVLQSIIELETTDANIEVVMKRAWKRALRMFCPRGQAHKPMTLTVEQIARCHLMSGCKAMSKIDRIRSETRCHPPWGKWPASAPCCKHRQERSICPFKNTLAACLALKGYKNNVPVGSAWAIPPPLSGSSRPSQVGTPGPRSSAHRIGRRSAWSKWWDPTWLPGSR